MDDLKPIVAHSYLSIIKGTLNRILYYEIETIMNYLIRFHIDIKDEKSGDKILADEALIITDKVFIYRKIWKAILETLYQRYLPHHNYSFDWIIEVTPYTLMLCEFTNDYCQHKDYDKLKELLDITDQQIETEYLSVIGKIGLEKIGIPNGLEDLIPSNLLPKTKGEQLKLLFRLMCFPPLGELSLFQNHYNNFIKEQSKQLSVAFLGIDAQKIPSFGMPETLRLSYFHLHHETFKKYGIENIKTHKSLIRFKGIFEKIIEKAQNNKDAFKDSLICPCCGKTYEIDLPQEILQYKYLLENQPVCKQIGLVYFNEFVENYKTNISDHFYSFLPNINKVDNPKVLILVEGESEEWAIPIFAFRKRYVLSDSNIQVYNSKSKEKLSSDFFAFRKNYPNRKIICLLDFDAKKEKANIERVIKDNKNKYHLVFIEKGTFEDIFDIDVSINILNELYPEGEKILKEDFDVNKDFLSNINSIMFHKKKAKFDKVLFAKTIALKMDIEKTPKEIDEILLIAENFTKPTKFIKQV